jgi:hypothetical protein
MSLHLEFEPHSWYMGFAIKYDENYNDPCQFSYEPYSKNCIVHGEKRMMVTDDYCDGFASKWQAFTDDGNTYRIVDLQAKTLKRLHEKIRKYHLRKHNGYGERIAKRRLEQLRIELRAERISTGELAELQGLSNYIDKGDVELLEPAGVPE